MRKFIAAEALQGASSLNFDARGGRLANEFGRRDYATVARTMARVTSM